jgi:hypothetical protein
MMIASVNCQVDAIINQQPWRCWKKILKKGFLSTEDEKKEKFQKAFSRAEGEVVHKLKGTPTGKEGKALSWRTGSWHIQMEMSAP